MYDGTGKGDVGGYPVLGVGRRKTVRTIRPLAPLWRLPGEIVRAVQRLGRQMAGVGRTLAVFDGLGDGERLRGHLAGGPLRLAGRT